MKCGYDGADLEVQAVGGGDEPQDRGVWGGSTSARRGDGNLNWCESGRPSDSREIEENADFECCFRGIAVYPSTYQQGESAQALSFDYEVRS